MDPLLEVKDVTKIFKRSGQSDFTAVDQISFELYPGETLGIVGESGSGKSTLARLIVRLLDVTSGKIFLDQQELTRLKRKKLREVYQKIQMVFQSPAESFDPRRTLGDGIGESLTNNGLSRTAIHSKVESLLQQCDLPASYAKRYPHEVSGGQCQRASIARALAIQPKILICDEATSALDVTVQKQIITLLQSLQEEHGMAYLFISHDLALVQQFCDRVLVMNEGTIVESGTPDEIIMNPVQDYTKQLVDAVL